MNLQPATNGRALTPIPELLRESDSFIDLMEAEKIPQKIIDLKSRIMRTATRAMSLSDFSKLRNVTVEIFKFDDL